MGPGNPIWQSKPKKVKKRRVYSLETMMRKRDKYGQPKYPELIKAEKECKATKRISNLEIHISEACNSS